MPVTRRRLPVDECDGSARPVAPRHRSIRARLCRGALLVAAGTAALSLGGPFALRPFSDVAGAAGDVAIGFVLDLGGANSDQIVGCVKVPPTDNGYQALAAFTARNHVAAPTYNASGLLCSIGGVPASGCGQEVAGGYIYWSYWTATGGSWKYSNVGAFASVTPGVVQGWRFQDPGPANAGAPPPRTAPDYDALCGQVLPPPTTTQPPTTAASHGGAGTHRAHRRAASRAADARVAAIPNSYSTSTSSSSTTTTSTYPQYTTTTLPSVSVPADPETGVVTTTKHASGSGGGPGPDPIIIGGLLIAALAVAGYTRWRKRPREP